MSNANKYLRDVRTVPRIAALLELCTLVLDSETPEELAHFRNLSMAFFGSDPKRIKWSDPDDPPSTETHLSRFNAEGEKRAREIHAAIMGED